MDSHAEEGQNPAFKSVIPGFCLVTVDFEVCCHEWSKQPRPNRAIMICGVSATSVADAFADKFWVAKR